MLPDRVDGATIHEGKCLPQYLLREGGVQLPAYPRIYANKAKIRAMAINIKAALAAIRQCVPVVFV